MEETSHRTGNQWLRITGTLLSLALLAYLLWQQDWQELWRQVRGVSLWVWLGCFGLYFSGQVFNALRWYTLLRSKQVQITFLECFKLILTGAFASNFLPSTVGGDVLRVMGSQPFTGSYTLSLASVLLDRGLNVFAMLATLPFSFFTFTAPDVHLDFNQQLSSAPALGLPAFRRMLEKALKKFKDALLLWFNQPRVLAAALVISWLSVLVIFAGNTILAHHLGMPVKFYQVVGVNAITYLLTLLPITFNGYGVREVLITTLYVALGGSLEQAASLAVITRFFMLLETLPGSLWIGRYLSLIRLSKESLVSEPRLDGENGNRELTDV